MKPHSLFSLSLAALLAGCQPADEGKAPDKPTSATAEASAATNSNPVSHPLDAKPLMNQAEAENDHCRGGHGDNPETMRACNRRQKLLTELERRGWCLEENAEQHWVRCADDPDYRPGQYGSEPPYTEEDIREASRSNTAKLEGMSYGRARTIILEYGWKPAPGECVGGAMDYSTCKRFPEIGNCSGTGLGFCDMTFVRKDRCLSLVTVGGAPGDDEDSEPVVRDVRFSRGPCQKDPNEGKL